jgi:hypothetical protein
MNNSLPLIKVALKILQNFLHSFVVLIHPYRFMVFQSRYLLGRLIKEFKTEKLNLGKWHCAVLDCLVISIPCDTV